METNENMFQLGKTMFIPSLKDCIEKEGEQIGEKLSMVARMDINDIKAEKDGLAAVLRGIAAWAIEQYPWTSFKVNVVEITRAESLEAEFIQFILVFQGWGIAKVIIEPKEVAVS